ncbi:hypothetical protein LINGRAHAP2_LOCUS12239, partial [Linum grandiflorum]
FICHKFQEAEKHGKPSRKKGQILVSSSYVQTWRLFDRLFKFRSLNLLLLHNSFFPASSSSDIQRSKTNKETSKKSFAPLCFWRICSQRYSTD